MFVVMSRECFNGCNCSCFETDEVFGPFKTSEEAEAWGKRKFKRFGLYRTRQINEPVG